VGTKGLNNYSDRIAQSLVEAGMGAFEAAKKAALFEKAEAELQANEGSTGEDSFRIFAPGRIEFLGKHTDYAGGPSMLCAVERGVCMVVRPRADDRVNIYDASYDEFASFTVTPELTLHARHWCVYAQVVARRLARNFPGTFRAADIAFASDLPPAAGISSSAALTVAFFLAFARVNQIEDHPRFIANIRKPEELADYLGAVENGFNFGELRGDRGVGTLGGCEDHTAILCCRPNELSMFSFRPVTPRGSFRVPDEYTFVIGLSGIKAEKTLGALADYNRASALAATIHRLWIESTGRDDATLLVAAGHSPEAPELIREVLRGSRCEEFSPEELLARFDQFAIETLEVIPAVADRLSKGDFSRIGDLVDRSQVAAERLLGNQCAETITLARSARELGAVAASAFGAGFGGSVWALVEKSDAEQFVHWWGKGYRQAFPARRTKSSFFSTRAGPAVITL
jgi:galactokinase